MSEKIIDGLKANKYTRKELENLLSNAEAKQREDLIPLIIESLKEVDFKSYSKRYLKPIKLKVEEIALQIAQEQSWAKWPDNKVKNGVKVGGDMLSGELIAEFYISYQHPSWQKSAYLSVFQRDENSAVGYAVRPHDSENYILTDTAEHAIAQFSKALEV